MSLWVMFVGDVRKTHLQAGCSTVQSSCNKSELLYGEREREREREASPSCCIAKIEVHDCKSQMWVPWLDLLVFPVLSFPDEFAGKVPCCSCPIPSCAQAALLRSWYAKQTGTEPEDLISYSLFSADTWCCWLYCVRPLMNFSSITSVFKPARCLCL